MTSNHLLRRGLARVCSPETIQRIVDPILADVRWEDGQITWRGYVALLNALGLHAVMSLPGWCAVVWTDDDYAIPRAAGFVLLGGTLVSTLLLGYATTHVTFEPKWSFFVRTAPLAYVALLPLSTIIAIPMAFRGQHVGPRLVRRTLVLLLLFVGAVYLVAGRNGIDAHETLQGVTIEFPDGRQVPLRREPGETVWAALRRQVRVLQRLDAPEPAARVEYLYQSRLVMASAVVPFGLAGLAICALQFDRRRPRLTGAAALILFVILFGTSNRIANRSVMPGLIADGSIYGVAVCAWTPCAIVLLAASTILLSSRHFIRPISADRGV